MEKPNAFKRFVHSIGSTFQWLFDFKDWKLLLRGIPGLITALFVVSVVIMNLMASKVIITTDIMAFDAGYLISWLPFLLMDIVTKSHGTKAAIKLTILGLLVNLTCIGIFQLVSSIQIGGDPAEYEAFNATFAQTWQIFVASSIAYMVSGIVNILLNALIGKAFKKNPDGRAAYICRSYVSTMIGQFVDNMIFAGLAFMVFFNLSVGSTFGYTWLSVFGAAVMGAVLELVLEMVFSPIGYRVCKKWNEEGVGKEYLDSLEAK